jgi:hypothetical protein
VTAARSQVASAHQVQGRHHRNGAGGGHAALRVPPRRRARGRGRGAQRRRRRGGGGGRFRGRDRTVRRRAALGGAAPGGGPVAGGRVPRRWPGRPHRRPRRWRGRQRGGCRGRWRDARGRQQFRRGGRRDDARHRHVRDVPGRERGARRSPLRPRPQQLHRLRAPLQHHPPAALRPAGHLDGRLPPVSRLWRRVPLPGRPPVPRPDDLVPPLRAPVALRSGRRRDRSGVGRP